MNHHPVETKRSDADCFIHALIYSHC